MRRKVGEQGRRYTVLLYLEEGDYSVLVPALPGCFSQADTIAEALANAREAIQLHIEGLEAREEPVPVEDAPPVTALVEV